MASFQNFIMLFLAVTMFSTTYGRLPPSAYIQMQRDAPEVLRINVIRVTRDAKSLSAAEITIVAEVLRVGKTATGLDSGDLITISYTVTDRGANWTGPAEIPILEEGTETIAYMRQAEQSTDYEPAAGAMSFSRFQ